MGKLSQSVRTALAMAELEFRKLKYDRTELYFRAVQPILWIMVFGPIMGATRALPTGGIPYTDYITPGVILQTTTFVAIFYGLTLVWERESGILKKLLSSPAPRYAIVLGRAIAAGGRAVIQVVIVIPFALLAGVSFSLNPLYILLAFFAIFLAAAGFAALSMTIASFMKTRERFMGLSQVISLPLFFASNALYPITLMPPILKTLATVNPLSYAVSAVRGLAIIGSAAGIPADFSALILFDFLALLAASISIKRLVE